MSEGKTRVTCEIIKQFRKPDIGSYILIIALKATIYDSWKKELSAYFGKYSVCMGKDRHIKYFQDSGNIFRPNEIVITSYETAIKDIDCYMSKPPALIIYDEIQYINNSEKLTVACEYLAELNEKTEFKLAMSGTPAQNSPDEFVVNHFFLDDLKPC